MYKVACSLETGRQFLKPAPVMRRRDVTVLRVDSEVLSINTSLSQMDLIKKKCHQIWPVLLHFLLCLSTNNPTRHPPGLSRIGMSPAVSTRFQPSFSTRHSTAHQNSPIQSEPRLL